MSPAKISNKVQSSIKGEVKVNGIVKTSKSNRGRKRSRASDLDSCEVKKLKVLSLEPPNISGGVVLTLGTGDIGQLGLGPDVEEKTKPCMISSLPSNIVSISAGGLHSLCLTSDGVVYSWGCNDEGALGRLTNSEEENFTPGPVKLDGKVVQISAGDCHSAALLSDGRVFAWGSFRDNSGPLGFLERETLQKHPRQLLEGVPVAKVSSGNNHLVLLAADGNVYTCGCGESGQLGRVAEVFANRNIRNREKSEKLLEPLPLKVFRMRKRILFDDVWAGGYTTFVRARETGLIYGFGLNNYCQLGDEDTNMKFQPVLLTAFSDRKFTQFAPGQHHSLALDEAGIAYVMGRSEYGRLGLGKNSEDALTPTPLKLDSKVTQVSAGECVSFVLTESGQVYGFGMGTNNQLGQADEEDQWVPTLMKGKQLETKKVVSVQSGGQHTILLATTTQ